jgi:hypothetical protein
MEVNLQRPSKLLRFVMACKLPFPVSGTKSFMKTDKDGLNKRRSYRLWKENVMT